MKECLEVDQLNRKWEEMMNMREGMEADHEKMMRGAVELARDKIINNGSSGGTNDAIPDLSMPSLMNESSDEKKIGITGIEHKYKDREEEKMRRSM